MSDIFRLCCAGSFGFALGFYLAAITGRKLVDQWKDRAKTWEGLANDFEALAVQSCKLLDKAQGIIALQDKPKEQSPPFETI